MSGEGPSLHIGIDASRAQASHPTGTEGYSLQIIRAMLALERPYDFTLYLRGCEIPPELAASPRTTLRVVRPRRLWTHAGLSAEMLRRPPDVLFVPAHVLPLWRPSRTVVTVHDLGYLYYPRAHGRASRWYLHLSTAFHARVATRLIADSEATKADLVKWYRADPARIQVVPLAAGDEFRPLSPAAAGAARDRYAGGRDYLLCLGTIQPRKNVAGLLDAYAALHHRRESPLLLIAGKRGWLCEPILVRAAALGLSDLVRFVDYVPRQDLPALITGALALVFPSFYEGFGLPALEAMACGTPVIASNCSSLPEVVADAGLLVDPHDTAALAGAMETVIADEALRRSFSARGLARAARYSWARSAEEAMGVLEDAAR